MKFISNLINTISKFIFKLYYAIYNNLTSRNIWYISFIYFLIATSDFDVKLFFINFLLSIPIIIILALLLNSYILSIVFTLLIGVLFHLGSLFKINILNDTANFEDFRLFLNIHKFAAWDLIKSYLSYSLFLYFFVGLAVVIYVSYYSDRIITRSKTINFFVKRFFMIFSSFVVMILFYNIIATPKIFSNSFSKLKYNREEYCEMVYLKDNKQKTYCKYTGPFAELSYIINSKELDGKPVYANSEFIKKILNENANYFDNLISPSILPNIIMVLNESTFNPKYLDYKFASGFKYDFFYEKKYTKAHGILKVHTLGGGSSTSEYPSVTGIVHNLFTSPSCYPFTSMTKITKNSIFKELKRLGYYTILVYPVDKRFFRASDAYQELGVDKVVDIFDYGFKLEKWRDIPDKFIAKMIISEIKKAPKSMPVFIYAATMINHGPHDEDKSDILGCSNEISDKLCSKINDYITRLDRTDKDFMEFSSKLMESQNPVVLINFGDHLPSFEGAISNMRFNYGDDEALDYYRTFYNIRANFDLNQDYNYRYMDISYFPGLILDIIGDKGRDEFYKANSIMRIKCKGRFFKCKENNYQLFESYKFMMIEQLGFIPECIKEDE